MNPWILPQFPARWVALMLLAGNSALGQFTIDWYTVDGGGGTVSEGAFEISATIGQPDAGSFSAGDYVIEGGFWGGTEDGQGTFPPTLMIEQTTPSSVLLSWPAPSTGFALQECSDICCSQWVKVSTTPQVVNGRKEVVVTPLVEQQFYRLSKP
jgi:hypothetical protein